MFIRRIGNVQFNTDELVAKLKEIGVTQEQIDEAVSSDGSLGLEDLANSLPQVENCDYLENDQFYLQLGS